MFRSAPRGGGLLFRAASTSAATAGRSTGLHRIAVQRRLISTAPPSQKSRSWTNRFVRLGLAGAVVYYYNTSTVFAEEPAFSLRPQPLEDENAPTLESLTSSSKKPQQTSAQSSVAVAEPTTQQPSDDGLEGLESQADQEGAFNPETGEINWDCPCLGGMAHGPCGEDFKAAFSCFVFSTEEPKGMDCIEKFKGMQDCFRQHPDVYGSELEEDEVDEQLQEHIASGAASDDNSNKPLPAEDYTTDPAAASLNASEKHAEAKVIRAHVEDAHEQAQKEEELVPKAWHNTADKDEESKKTDK